VQSYGDMRKELLSLARAEVPRYTSYPTAAQFHDGVGEAVYRRWLGELAGEQSLSLYLHVPFCRQLCWYCGCHTVVANDDTPVRRYADLMQREALLVREAIGDAGRVRHIHFGGGSPGLFGPEDFSSTMAHLRGLFDLERGAEIAIELDPRSMNDEAVANYAACGVNRVSFGVQEFARHVQQLINREQSFGTVRGAVNAVRAAGIERVSFDLMYGLPGQRVSDVIASAALTSDLRPDRVALFGYAHVPWFKSNQKLIRNEDLPSSSERVEQAQAAAEVLCERGYVRIGLDHFALEDDTLSSAVGDGLRRNFQGYTEDPADVLLGFGASAIGRLPGGYAQNDKNIRGYLDAIGAGRLAVVKGVFLSPEDRLRAAAIERLMCDLALDAGVLCDEMGFAVDSLDASLAATSNFETLGIVTRSGRDLRISEEGRPFVRSIAACFDAYFVPSTQEEPRHSKAV